MTDQLLSWHKVWQKVTLSGEEDQWFKMSDEVYFSDLPRAGEIYTLSDVFISVIGPAATLSELPHYDNGFLLCWFRPVYPSAVDALRNLDAPIEYENRVLVEEDAVV